VAEERVEPVEPVDGDAGGGALAGLAPRAIELLTDPARSVALAAAIYLSKLGREEGTALLLGVVDGSAKGKPDKEDEREAVEMAGALGLREAIPALERRAWGVMRVARDTCSFHAKIALARMGHERAVKEILDDLASSKRPVREAAVVAAGRAKLTQAKATIEGLADVDADLVRIALVALAETD
jgi:HEAT repeat protein